MPGSICDILPAAAAALGAPAAVDTLGLGLDAARVAVVLVDGMGTELLPLLANDAPVLAAASETIELTSMFPSTTPTSLVSLGTGVAPGEHGVLGFTLNVPGTDRVLNHIAWTDDPPPERWQPVPTWFRRLAAAGIAATAVLPAHFVGSGLTESAYRGARFRATGHGEDYAAAVVDALAAGPGLVYGYTGALDGAAHLFGIGSPQWHAAAADVGALLARLVEALPTDAALLVTADHGGLNVPEASRVDLDADPRLAAGVAVVAGEPRVRYLHTEPGSAPDVLAAWTEVLGSRAEVRSRDDAVAAGLFGPVRAEFLARIGDVVITCTGDTAVFAGAHEPPEVARLVGFHGAATRAETAIPLIVFRG